MSLEFINATLLNTQARLCLFCFPYAGGSTAVYHRWRWILPEQINVVPITLPGHDGRMREPPATNLRKIVGELYAELRPLLRQPYALMGYSMGAWLALEFAREARRDANCRPMSLTVAASRPPHNRSTDTPLHSLPDQHLIDALDRRYGGIPAAVRTSPDVLKRFLPTLRTDLQMFETYEHADEPPLEVPLLAMAGNDDALVSESQLAEWKGYTSADFQMYRTPGGHFFLFQQPNYAARGAEGNSQEANLSPPLQAMLTFLQRHTSSPYD